MGLSTMTEVTIEPMFEVLKRLQSGLDKIDENTRATSSQFQAIRDHMLVTQKDIGNIYTKLVGQDLRRDRIERRLDLISEPAE